MSPADIQLVRNGFAAVAADREGFAAAIFDRLFARDPGLRALFATDMKTHGQKLIAALAHVVRSLDRLDALIDDLRALARRHVAYGVEREHYDLLGEALLDALTERLGETFNAKSRVAWTAAYRTVAGTMIEAAGYHLRDCTPSAA
jgi:hemoglobin-like flavoprotein